MLQVVVHTESAINSCIAKKKRRTDSITQTEVMKQTNDSYTPNMQTHSWHDMVQRITILICVKHQNNDFTQCCKTFISEDSSSVTLKLNFDLWVLLHLQMKVCHDSRWQPRNCPGEHLFGCSVCSALALLRECLRATRLEQNVLA